MQPIITDHALLRYLERVGNLNLRDIKKKAIKMGYVIATDQHLLAFIRSKEGIDIEKIRNKLLTPELKAAIEVGAKTMKSPDGVIYMLHDKHVVTLYRHGPVANRGALKPALKKGQFAGIRKDRDWDRKAVDPDV